MEFHEWLVFQEMDPSGEHRADLRNAILCQTVALMLGAKTSIENFMPFHKRSLPSHEELERKVMVWGRSRSAK